MVRTYKMGICEICGESKPIPAKGLCMTCYNRLNRAKNHGRRMEQQQASRAANPEQTKIYNDQYKERRDQYYTDHPMIAFCGKQYRMKRHSRPPEGYLYHHKYYDHLDPENGIVLISSTSHQMGHALLRVLNIEIEHINMEI